MESAYCGYSPSISLPLRVSNPLLALVIVEDGHQQA
jgi:hypothetical protein